MRKKCSERCKHCVLAVESGTKTFRPTADPLPGSAGWQQSNQLEMVTTFTYKLSLVRIDAMQFRVIVVTDTDTYTLSATLRQDNFNTQHYS